MGRRQARAQPELRGAGRREGRGAAGGKRRGAAEGASATRATM